MTLPLCAICGCSLTQRDRAGARMTIDRKNAPHRPSMGWCETHFPEAHAVLADTRSLDVAMAEAEARGPGRVVRRVRA